MATRYWARWAAAATLAAGIGYGATVTAAAATPQGFAAVTPQGSAAVTHGFAAATHAHFVRAHARRPAHGRAHRRAAARVHALRDPAFAAIIGLRAIERVYRREGRGAEVPRFLRGVLARTGDATVRNYVGFRLARIELRGRDANGALEQLERGLDENLSRLK